MTIETTAPTAVDDTGLARQYDPATIEAPRYRWWLERGDFHAEVTPGQPRYCITIPPPNVTGELHMGHGLCYSIHDVLVRWKRMQGFSTLCLPGTDHAGIGTQNVVEKMLAGRGLTRTDLGREAFVDTVWAWKEKYGATIIDQLKILGCSFDWSRERFTMDADYSDAVLEEFIHLFEKGYIYRGNRVTNWCPRCGTAISDIEADDEERPGSLWYIQYPVEDGYAFGTEHITIATTRPETMLGDTAVAVHPDDPRYQSLIGGHVILPIMNRKIPIIGDPILVDPEFGTGALKVTPAHDFNDFEAGERNNLAQVTVIGPDGRMTEAAGEFAGMDRFEARDAVVERLRRDGLLVKTEDYTVPTPICDRCKTVLEPLLSEQWFCRMKELAAPAIAVVRSGEIRFVPERWNRVYLDWMERLRDWCISRQLWWGHRIPVYTCRDCGKTIAARQAPETCPACGECAWEQDPDVLDTWFSSALWPFATLGWPKQTPELDYFYPTDVLITAPEIIYLWVARMIMTGLEFRKQIPFPDVYIYATVLDARGDRMSKSKGNGINPLDLIAEYGADATRYGIITQAGKAQQIRFTPQIVAQARLFCSKVWQASRFVLMNLHAPPDDLITQRPDHSTTPTSQYPIPNTHHPSPITHHPTPITHHLADRWIFSRLAGVVKAVNEGLAGYDLDVATRALNDLVWSEFCDWYIEMAKPRLSSGDPVIRQNLRDILDTTLRLLHPLIPFLTEEIWQQLPGHGPALIQARFPEPDESRFDPEAEEAMERLMDLVVKIRNIRSELKVAPGAWAPVFLSGIPEVLRPWIELVEQRARCRVTLEERAAGNGTLETGGPNAISTSAGIGIRIPLEGLVDQAKERTRLQSEIAGLQKEREGLERQLANPQFVTRAPAAVVEEKRRRLADLQERLQQAANSLQRFGG